MNIVFNSVNKSYGIITALKDINLSIYEGEFLFVVGPSGAGKSTLLKMVLSQTRPTSGQLLVDDINLSQSKKSEVEKIRKKIGVIFQDYQLISDKSIEENIALALDIVSYPKSNIASKIDEVMKRVKLNNRRFLYPSQLSGGELQRAALARALAVEPKVILADEPTGNLDAQNSWNLIKLLKDINEEFGTTVIMTTHNLDIVESLNKRVVYLKNGQIEKETKP
jgi:cell division transport system ATP-binding protein